MKISVGKYSKNEVLWDKLGQKTAVKIHER